MLEIFFPINLFDAEERCCKVFLITKRKKNTEKSFQQNFSKPKTYIFFSEVLVKYLELAFLDLKQFGVTREIKSPFNLVRFTPKFSVYFYRKFQRGICQRAMFFFLFDFSFENPFRGFPLFEVRDRFYMNPN